MLTTCTLLVPIGVLFTGCRDTNGLLVAGLSLLLLLFVVLVTRRIPPLQVWVASLSLLACGIAAHQMALKAERHRNPLSNVIFQRILPDKEKTRFFVEELQMPMNAALQSRSGKRHSSDGWFLFRSAELEEYRHWMKEQAPGEYPKYLLADFAHAWKYGVGLFPRASKAEFNNYQPRPVVPDEERSLGLAVGKNLPFHRWPWWSFAFALSTGVFGSAFLLRGQPRLSERQTFGLPLTLMAIATSVAAICLSFVSFHSDALEPLRHAAGAPLLASLALIFALVALAEQALALIPTSRAHWLLMPLDTARFSATGASLLLVGLLVARWGYEQVPEMQLIPLAGQGEDVAKVWTDGNVFGKKGCLAAGESAHFRFEGGPVPVSRLTFFGPKKRRSLRVTGGRQANKLAGFATHHRRSAFSRASVRPKPANFLSVRALRKKLCLREIRVY